MKLLSGFGFGIPLGVVAGMLAVQRQTRARPGPGMRGALWASRALAANFVLVLAVDSEGPVYAATLTASTRCSRLPRPLPCCATG